MGRHQPKVDRPPPALRLGLQRHVDRQVGAGPLADHRDPARISAEARSMLAEPAPGSKRILVRRGKPMLRRLPIVRRYDNRPRSLRQTARRGVIVVHIAEHEGAGVEVEDQRPRRAGLGLRRVDPRANILGRTGDQPHLHVDMLVVVAVAQDAAQRHVEPWLCPCLWGPQRLNRPAAHLPQDRQDMPHVGIEPLGGRSVWRHSIPTAIGSERAHLHRCHGEALFSCHPDAAVRPQTRTSPAGAPPLTVRAPLEDRRL
jgi:hypothetical protein